VYRGPSVGPEDWSFFCKLFNQPEHAIGGVYANTLNIHDKWLVENKTPARRTLNFFRESYYSRAEKIWYIKIESGCKNCCTYCTDRLAFKWVKSQPVETVIEQFAEGLRRRYRYFYFVGRDLGSYGHDLGLTLPSLLDRIFEKYPYQDYRLFLRNVSPNSLIDMLSDFDRSFYREKCSNWAATFSLEATEYLNSWERISK
jgi:tRNA A37 methylthiotransferase MiaB